MFGYFWERFWAFLNFENFLIFKKYFDDSTLHGTLGMKFSKNFPQNMFKTRLDTFGNTFGHFWNLKIYFFENFSKTRPSLENWAKIFRKNCPKTQSKHVWILLGTSLGVFRILKIFLIFFENFLRLDPPWKTRQKFLEKFAPKHVQNMFGYFWERFWAFLNFENFLIFKKYFDDSTLHGTLGMKFFRKKHPKTRLETFGNTFGHFWNFEKKILRKFPKTRHSMENWAKIFRKIFPKTC